MSITAPTGPEIRQARQWMDLSQVAFAERIGSSRRTVEDWEAGRRPAPPMLRYVLAAIHAKLEPWNYPAPPPAPRLDD